MEVHDDAGLYDYTDDDDDDEGGEEGDDLTWGCKLRTQIFSELTTDLIAPRLVP